MKIYDYLIIGTGIAGLNSALNCSKNGTVLLLTKSKASTCSTSWAQGGIAGVLAPSDSIKQHVEDTITAGAFHNNKKAVEYLAKHSKMAITKLRELGVPFESNADHTLKLAKEGGHSQRRIAYVGDYTGKSVEDVLINKVQNSRNITLIEDCMVIQLLVEKNKCYGVQAIANDKVENHYAYHTILASGGLGQIYQHTTNPSVCTGDGIALAQNAGAKMKDMEYIQFHPTAFDQKSSTKFLLSEALRGEGAVLKNSKKQAFMAKYSPLKDLAPRDIVARSIYNEQKNGQVYLDITHLAAKEVKKRFPQIYKTLKKYGFDLTKEMIPITPAAHYLCGGVATNLKGQTSVKNLFAYGEVAYTGVHGANRLASNSLLEGIVFSENISKFKAAKTFKVIPTFKRKKLVSNSKLTKQLNKIQQECKNILWEKVGIIRNQKNLLEAKINLENLQAQLAQLTQSASATQITNTKLAETHNMLTTGLLITKSAISNKNSLGCHYITKPAVKTKPAVN